MDSQHTPPAPRGDVTRPTHQPGLKKERAVLLMGVITGLLLLTFAILLVFNSLGTPPGAIVARSIFALFLTIASAVNLSVGVGFLRFKPTTRLLTLLLLTYLPLAVGSVLFTNAGPPAALIALVYSISMGTAAGYGRQADRVITVGMVSGMTIALLNLFPFTESFPAPHVAGALWVILAAVTVAFLLLRLSNAITATVRLQIVTFAIASAVIPLGLAAYFSIQFQLNALEAQFKENIRLTTQQTVDQVEAFFAANKEQAVLDANFPVFARYLTTPVEQRAGSEVEQELVTTTQTLDKFRQRSFLMGYGLLDPNGVVVYDTNVSKIGRLEIEEPFFAIPFNNGLVYTSPIRFPLYEAANIVFSSPIMDNKANVLGVLRIQYNAEVFSALVQPSENLYGDTAYPVLIDGNSFRVVDTFNPELNAEPIVEISQQEIYNLKVREYLPVRTSGKPAGFSAPLARAVQQGGIYPYTTVDLDPQAGDREEIIYTQRLKSGNPPYTLAFIQKQEQVLAAFQQQQNSMVLAATLIAGVVSLLGTLVSQLISRPVLELRDIAEQISAGDINAFADIRSQDELGDLANAFNIMTARLRDLIGSLEDRVRARTEALAEQNKALLFRSQQLNTVSEVAQRITSTRELEELFALITRLITERFGFYHTGIFLLDERGEYAVLRAANSAGGKRMLERQHRLKVGQIGLVGYATGSGKPRIATDVGEDSIYFNNPLLPETRSEMALPLIADQKIIGALDVQSKESDAFSAEDVELFSTLADQIAIAINNNALLEETARALAQMEGLHRQYLQQAWQKESGKREESAYLFTPRGLSRQAALRLPEIDKAVALGTPVLEVRQGEGGRIENTLAVPIRLRGETIGTIHMKESSEQEAAWGDKEIAVVNQISDQIAVGLENARLFEQTVRRAERERKVLEITGQIRATNDPAEMLRIAAAALQRELPGARAQVILQKQESEDDPTPSNGKHPAPAKTQ